MSSQRSLGFERPATPLHRDPRAAGHCLLQEILHQPLMKSSQSAILCSHLVFGALAPGVTALPPYRRFGPSSG